MKLLRYGPVGAENSALLARDGSIRDLSGLMTLHPGDVIITGTPAGVGQGMKPPVYLLLGQVVSLEIERLGEQRQAIVSDAA